MAARKKPANGLPLELMDAMVREYGEWRRRVEAEDPNVTTVLSADEKYMLESHRLAVDAVTRVRNLIFSDLVSRGFQEIEVCQRLLIGRKTYLKLVRKCFDISDVKNLRSLCHARTLERLGKLRSQRLRMEEISNTTKGGFTNAERSTYLQIIKLENELEASLRKMHGADAPEQVEVKETKTVSVSLEIKGTRDQLSGLLDSPDIIDVPALPPPEISDGL